MQLFITDFKENWENIIIENAEILEQTRKVLRMKIWDKFFVQRENKRIEIEIVDRDKKTIKWKTLNIKQEQSNTKKQQNSIAIAMPNKRAKAELIVQKLSEIWINNIYFRPSERSILKERNNKKFERLEKISKEAVEQSRWRELPKIEFTKDISKIIQNKKVLIFDKTSAVSSLSETKDINFMPFKTNNQPPLSKEIKDDKNTLWIIGPEWWLTKNDYQKFWDNYKTISLWDNILRMETASIIWAWFQKNID